MFKPGVETEFQVIRYDGTEETHKLLYNQYSVLKFEEQAGKSIQDFFTSFQKNEQGEISLSFRDIHVLFWAGMEGSNWHRQKVLRKNHLPMSLDDACEFIDGVGGIMLALGLSMPALKSALPDTKDIQELTALNQQDGDGEEVPDPNLPRVPEIGPGASEQPTVSDSIPTPSGA